MEARLLATNRRHPAPERASHLRQPVHAQCAVRALHRSNATLNVDVLTDANGVIAQVNAPEGLVNVAVINQYQYQLQMFYHNNVTAKTNGFYGTNGPAFDTWTIQNPNGGANANQLVLTESLTGRQFTYTYGNVSGVNQWQLADSGGIRTVCSWQTQDPVQSNVTNIFTQVLSGNNCVQMTQKGYIQLGSVVALADEIDGQAPTTNTTTCAYSGANLLQQVNYPNGNWDYYVYDGNGRVVTKYAAFGNSTPPLMVPRQTPLSIRSPRRITTTPMRLRETTSACNLPWRAPKSPAGPLMSAGTSTPVEISRSTGRCHTPTKWTILCPTPGAAWNDPANLITRTCRYATRPIRTPQPDQLAGRPEHHRHHLQLPGRHQPSLDQYRHAGRPAGQHHCSHKHRQWHADQKALNAWGQVVSVTTVAIANGAPGLLLSPADLHVHRPAPTGLLRG